MIAIVVHQVVPIAAELIADLLDQPAHLVLGEIGAADLNALPEAKLLAQLVVIARLDLKDAGERVRMAAVRELGAKDLDARMEDAQPQIRCVLVDPVLDGFWVIAFVCC